MGDYAPSIGGGYTLQQEIFRAIESLGPASGHEFVFFTTSAVASTGFSTGLKVVPCDDPNRGNRVAKACRVMIACFAAAVSRRVSSRFFDRWADPVKALLREEGIDVIWSVVPSCLCKDIPYITTVWDLQHRVNPFFPEVSIEHEWESREEGYRHLLQRAAYVVTGTRAGMLEIMNFYQIPPARIRILPFPAPTFHWDSDPAKDLAVLESYGIRGGYLFYPAQFWPHKNHYGVLQSLLALRRRHGLTLPAVFVGSDKGNLSYIRSQVSELGLDEQVHFLGFVPREHLSALYRQAFALFFLTYCGPDNLPPLEAFAHHCPVIASDVAGAEEQMGDAALLVDPKDPDHVADAVHRLHRDRELRQTLVARGADRASRLTAESYFKGICSMLDEFGSVRRTWSDRHFKLAR